MTCIISWIHKFEFQPDWTTCLVNSTVRSKIWLKYFRAFMVVLVTCKNEEDLIKNKDARVLTSLYVDFSDAQGQLPPQSVVEFRQIRTHSSFYGCPCYQQE